MLCHTLPQILQTSLSLFVIFSSYTLYRTLPHILQTLPSLFVIFSSYTLCRTLPQILQTSLSLLKCGVAPKPALMDRGFQIGTFSNLYHVPDHPT
ncbi:hypothetical protein J6590_070500 [Homalodisca vitripennis]|nr:hypothetical protein J6590_070500 [Homalodisca vitripennis]